VKARIHPTFHVSLLKPYRSDGTVQPPPPVEVDGELEYEVEDILQVRTVTTNQRRRKDNTLTNGRQTNHYLVKWKGYGFEHCSWLPESELTHCSELLCSFKERHALMHDVTHTSVVAKAKRVGSESAALAAETDVAHTRKRVRRA
jgi:hypothetical protein